MAWQPGQSGNPRGKRTGTRDRISEAYLRDLHDAWRRKGTTALDAAADNDPVAFCALVARLLPKEHVHEAGESLIDALRQLAGQPVAALPDESAALHDGGVAGHA